MEPSRLTIPEWIQVIRDTENFRDMAKIFFNFWKQFQKYENSKDRCHWGKSRRDMRSNCEDMKFVRNFAISRLREFKKYLTAEEARVYKLCFNLLDSRISVVDRACDGLRETLWPERAGEYRGTPITFVPRMSLARA